MKYIIICLLAFSPLVAFSQMVVEGVNLNESKEVGYIEMYLKPMPDGIFKQVVLLWGDGKGFFGYPKTASGEVVKFASEIAALNWAYGLGWELERQYNAERWWLRRRPKN